MKLTFRLFTAVASVLLINLVLIAAFGNLFLESYYLTHKKEQISNDFDALYSIYAKGDAENTQTVITLIEGKNTRVQIHTLIEFNAGPFARTAYALMYTSDARAGSDVFVYREDLLTAWNSAGIGGGTLLRLQDAQSIQKLSEALGESRAAFIETSQQGSAQPQQGTSQQGQLMLFGRLDDKTVVSMLTPLDAVRESAILATRFSLLSGLIALGAGILVTLGVSMLLSRPLKQVTAVAGDIARLDFSRRVPISAKAQKRRKKDEVQELSESINSMADSLERNHQALSTYNQQLRRDIDTRILTEQAQKALVSNISHELKTPLAIISGYAEGLRDGLADDEQTRGEYCGIILEESRNMTRLIQNLLRLTRLQSGFAEPCPTEIEFPALADRILDSLSLSAKQKNLTIERAYAELRPAWADPDACEQVFRNYTVNALRYAPEGGVVRVTLREIVSAAGAECVRLEVYNSGSNVAEEDRERIWDSFYRSDAARNREGGEVGLGLAIVKAHMTAHGGSYGCENTKDGVVFYAEFKVVTV